MNKVIEVLDLSFHSGDLLETPEALGDDLPNYLSDVFSELYSLKKLKYHTSIGIFYPDHLFRNLQNKIVKFTKLMKLNLELHCDSLHTYKGIVPIPEMYNLAA